MADRVLLGKKQKTGKADQYGLWVSESTYDVTDPNLADENLLFDSSNRALSTLRIIQSGTFQIQCKKTFMGKKGALEIGSDEQMRANADYTKRYPFELDTVPEFAEYYASLPKNANVALYGFGEGEVPFTGNAFNQQYVQNVYCDYGTQTIKFDPPLPDHIKTPYVSVFFAVGNSSGHFHPWYANVECNNSQYDWQYANSQQCVHMDSAWFRGKWTFRERSFAPLGHDVNLQFPSELETLEGDFYDSSATGKSTVFPDPVGTGASVGEALSGLYRFHVGSGGSIKDPATVDPSFVGVNQDFTSADSSRFSRLLSRYNEISFNVGDRDLHSPSSLWGGMLKSFAGLQGVTYFANSTHLKLDAFMTPTHTPTPFETEIVKTRESRAVSIQHWHPDAGSNFDQYGNYRVNVGRFDGVDQFLYGNVENNAFANGFSRSYEEKLPRKFRTKYWDGSQTEHEWWPIGHANGAFTIAKLQTTAGVDIKGPGFSLADTYAQEENDRLVAEKGIPNKYQLGTVPDATTIPDAFGKTNPVTYGGATYPTTSVGGSPWFAVAHGDYTILREPGNDPKHEGTPFITTVNKGTRFSNQLPDTEAKGYPPNSQYEPGDAFLKTRTFQGQPTSLDSFWNSFSNNRSQWVSSNTPYGEFYYADGGYAMDNSPYYNYGGADNGKVYAAEKFTYNSRKYIKVIPSDWNIQRQSFAKHNWNGGNPKAGVGTEGRRFGFGGAGSAEALGGEGEGVFDTYYGRYIVYDIVGGQIDE